MATIHLLLQGKGGVGKSLIASILFQYLSEHGVQVFGCDTDPVNATFTGYKEFDVQALRIMKGDDIDQRLFDQLIDYTAEMPDNAHLVVDNGASCFVALCGYLKENSALEYLADQGHEVLIHTVVTGGQAIGDTLAGLSSLTQHFSDTPLVVWLNPYFGEIRLEGEDFYQFKVYTAASANFRAVIELPELKPNTFGKDLAELLALKWSFNAGIKSSLPVMTRQRLSTTWRRVKAAVDRACFV
jgi:hypothetical protein